MKPTQQEIIELAREAGIREQMPSEDDLPAVWLASTPEIIRLVHLALERFGAGGGEPMFWYRPCSNGMYEGPIHDAQIESVRRESGAWKPLFPHPSPTDLRAEYVRGLAEGFKEGWIECSKWAQRNDLIADIGSPSYGACVSAVKALKGKQ